MIEPEDTKNESRPSDLLRLKQEAAYKEQQGTDSWREMEKHFEEIDAEMEPYLKVFEKYKDEPKEIRAYLQLKDGDHYLIAAVDQFYIDTVDELQRDKDFWQNEVNIEVLKAINENNAEEQVLPHEMRLDKTDNPNLLLTLWYLQDYSQRDYHNKIISLQYYLERKLEPFSTPEEKLTDINSRLFHYKEHHRRELRQDASHEKQTFTDDEISKHPFLNILLQEKIKLEALLKAVNSPVLVKPETEVLDEKLDDVLSKKQLEANEDKKSNTPEFTTTRQVLALRYLLEFVQAKDKKNNARKNFVHFVTGKDKSTVFKKFDDEGLAYNKGGDDLSFVRKQFEDLGLTEILTMIDNDSV